MSDTPAPAPAAAPTPGPAPAAAPAPAPAGAPTPAAAPVPAAAPSPAPTAADDKGADDKKTEPAGAPEKYEFVAPDGSTLDAAVVAAYADAAKELNLTQDAAQEVLSKVAPVIAARQQEQVAAMHKEWVGLSTADKEFGGDKLQENLGIAKNGLQQHATPALRTLLEDSGLGNHPEVVRHFYRLGKSIKSDSVVTGGTGNPPNDMASRLYPSHQ